MAKKQDVALSDGTMAMMRAHAATLHEYAKINTATQQLIVTIAPPGATRKPIIPPDKRTIPMSLKRAAKLIGKLGNPKDAAEWLRASIDDGSYQAEQVSRQNWVFNIDAFPASAQLAVTGGKQR